MCGGRTENQVKLKIKAQHHTPLHDRNRDEKWTRIFERRLVVFQVDMTSVDTVHRGVRSESLKPLSCRASADTLSEEDGERTGGGMTQVAEGRLQSDVMPRFGSNASTGSGNLSKRCKSWRGLMILDRHVVQGKAVLVNSIVLEVIHCDKQGASCQMKAARVRRER